MNMPPIPKVDTITTDCCTTPIRLYTLITFVQLFLCNFLEHVCAYLINPQYHCDWMTEWLHMWQGGEHFNMWQGGEHFNMWWGGEHFNMWQGGEQFNMWWGGEHFNMWRGGEQFNMWWVGEHFNVTRWWTLQYVMMWTLQSRGYDRAWGCDLEHHIWFAWKPHGNLRYLQ